MLRDEIEVTTLLGRATACLCAGATNLGCAPRGLPGKVLCGAPSGQEGCWTAQFFARHAPPRRRCMRSCWRECSRARLPGGCFEEGRRSGGPRPTLRRCSRRRAPFPHSGLSGRVGLGPPRVRMARSRCGLDCGAGVPARKMALRRQRPLPQPRIRIRSSGTGTDTGGSPDTGRATAYL